LNPFFLLFLAGTYDRQFCQKESFNPKLIYMSINVALLSKICEVPGAPGFEQPIRDLV